MALGNVREAEGVVEDSDGGYWKRSSRGLRERDVVHGCHGRKICK